MSSRKQTRSVQGKRKERGFDLAQHYREVGIKAVAAASRNSPDRATHSTTIAEKEKSTKEDNDER